jgi:hypothetical protein
MTTYGGQFIFFQKPYCKWWPNYFLGLHMVIIFYFFIKWQKKTSNLWSFHESFTFLPKKNTNSYHLSNLGAMLTCRCSIEMQKHLGKSSNGLIMVYEHLIKPKRIKSFSITLYTTNWIILWQHKIISTYLINLYHLRHCLFYTSID